MDRLKNYMKAYSAKDYIKFVVILVSIAGLLAAIAYVYKTYVVPKLNPSYTANKEFINKDSQENFATMQMFSADWCPHCKAAKPHYNEFKEKYNGKVIGGYTVKITTVNCTKETAEVQKLVKKYDVKGYPTVNMIKDGKTYKYDAKVSTQGLEQFLKSVLG